MKPETSKSSLVYPEHKAKTMKSISNSSIQHPQLPKRLAPAGEATIEDHETYEQLLFADLNWTGIHAPHAAFEAISMRRVILMNARLSSTRLQDSRLESCDSSGTNWEKAHFRRVEWTGCRLLGAQFIETSIEDVLFKDCGAERVNFAHAKFKACRFQNCFLQGAFFAGADLSGVVFDSCDLSEADFREAKLNGTDFRTSTLNSIQVGVKELQGAVIAPFQAVQVVSLLGLVVKDIDET